MMHEYQLVIQFRGDSLEELDAAVEMEEEFGSALGRKGDVDGHDVGSGEINIFIHTADPVHAFEIIKSVLERNGVLKSVTAAYRRIEGNDYTVIWPISFKGRFVVK